MSVTREAVMEALSRVIDPELNKDLVSAGMIKQVDIDGDNARISVELTSPACPLKEHIGNEIERELSKVDGLGSVQIQWGAKVRSTEGVQQRIPGVKNTIAIGAGKGGVGKSTIAVLAAIGLQREGAKVGLLDADVYGPSIPKLMGIENQQPGVGEKTIVPVEAHGVKVMSIGFMIEPGQAVIWRGPMIHSVVQQFLQQVEWGELDYLIIDLPPGTGDVPLTLSQTVPMTGAVIVCTPQEVALLDAVRAMRMYQQLNVGILGFVENMSYFIAPDTGKEYDLFGRGGAKRAAERVGAPFLGEIPINIGIRESGDAGTPASILDDTDEATRNAIMTFVRNMAGRISIANAAPQQPSCSAGTCQHSSK
ncbi:MAG: Mrp/NBP35 family ATP-binding protein [Planctomycetota bacterium]